MTSASPSHCGPQLPFGVREAPRRGGRVGPPLDLGLLAIDPALRGLGEQEALALLLRRCCRACPLPDQMAAALLARFGDWPRVMGATLAELSALAGPAVAHDLRLVCHLLLRGLAFELRQRSVLASGAAVGRYLRADMAGRGRESFRVLFLDRRHRLIRDEVMGEGTVDHAPAYPREVMRRALELNASGCCLAHNHPSGSPEPSAADIAMTRAVEAAGRTLGIVVHDHYLVAGDTVVSFRALGLM